DNGGHMFRSNSGDGSARIYYYDYEGNLTLTLASAGTLDLSTYTTDTAYPLFTSSSSSIVATITVYDKKGFATGTYELGRDLTPLHRQPRQRHRPHHDPDAARRHRLWRGRGCRRGRVPSRRRPRQPLYRRVRRPAAGQRDDRQRPGAQPGDGQRQDGPAGPAHPSRRRPDRLLRL